jgi:hypothetical protein
MQRKKLTCNPHCEGFVFYMCELFALYLRVWQCLARFVYFCPSLNKPTLPPLTHTHAHALTHTRTQVHVAVDGRLPCTVVTGGGRGLGRLIAARMCRHTPVVLVGRDATALAAAASTLTELGNPAAVVQGDVSVASTADEVARVVTARGWRVANIIANAGFGKTGPVHALPRTHLDAMWGVNVLGAHHLLRHFVPDMIRDGVGGTVVLVSSYVDARGVGRAHVLAVVSWSCRCCCTWRCRCRCGCGCGCCGYCGCCGCGCGCGCCFGACGGCCCGCCCCISAVVAAIVGLVVVVVVVVAAVAVVCVNNLCNAYTW